MLTDGGIQGNMPLQYLSDDECRESLVIGFSNGQESVKKNPEDLMTFMRSVMGCLIHQNNEALLLKWNHLIIRIPVDEFPSWNFEASREDRLMLLQKGIDATKAWLAKPPRSLMQRRSSI